MPIRSTHSEFHRKAARAARTVARGLYAAAGFDRTSPTYQQGQMMDRGADLHDLAAHGTMMFDDCPDCALNVQVIREFVVSPEVM